MVSMLASSGVDHGIEPKPIKLKTIKLVFVASQLSTQFYGARAKTGWLRIRIMCPSGETCLLIDCYFNEQALQRSN